MEIKIEMEGKTFSAVLEPDAAELAFKTCVRSIVRAENNRARYNEPLKNTHVAAYEIPAEQQKEQTRYKGFMLLKCPSCGAVKGFCAKKEMKGYHCFECGHDSLFSEPLRNAKVRCKCGMGYTYKTNMEEEMFEVDCLKCGAPVALKWNGRRKAYEPMGD